MSRLGANVPHKAARYIGAAAAALSCVSLLEIIPHTLCIERYKKFLAKYKRGEEVPVHENTKKLFSEVLDDLKVKPKYKELYEPFIITGFDTYNAGIATNRCKVIIGIPSYFIYKNKSLVDVMDIRIGSNRALLNPYDPTTENLVESLVLSEKAKKYGIAREVLMSQWNLPLYRVLESPTIITCSIIISDVMQKRYQIFQKPLIVAVFAYFGLGLMSFATWFQIRDALNNYFEKSVDEQLAKLGRDYVEGGKEFYEKLLKRNVAVRKLLGPHGKKRYNQLGDEIRFIRHKKTPLTERKKFFEDYKVPETLIQGERLTA
ncbi:transmembrane protein 177 [Copidosoma floridanum]|uniref:transmembrane protein 177 n=1 Tax=Copidosoma floridanum TaxID=29053 RepID=UPI0006C97E70|nr:transmembrane protein 177 [Copidosoma floridanum]